MTTTDNLNRIIQAKSDIKTAIENKGVTVGNITIDGYAEKINQITVGESGKTVLPNGICLRGSTWETFDTTQYDWSKIRDMSNMFSNCTNLTSLDVSNWDTSKVTDMGEMFTSCVGLTSLDVSNWDTSNVTTMFNMFVMCGNLTSLDVSNWDTSNVTDMSYMFQYCTNLTTINGIENWDTSNVTKMVRMFNNCDNLTSIDLSNWDTSNVTNMNNMFESCDNLTEVRMGGDVSKVTNVSYMFRYIATTGTFYYNSNYDYSNIIAQLPSTWTAVPME